MRKERTEDSTSVRSPATTGNPIASGQEPTAITQLDESVGNITDSSHREITKNHMRTGFELLERARRSNFEGEKDIEEMFNALVQRIRDSKDK